MALVANLSADFEQFYREAKKAQAELVAIKTSGDAIGPTLDRSFSTVGSGAGKATQAFGQMVGGLDAVDRSLAAFGLNIGREMGMLRELSSVLTTTTTGFGTLATAAAGAAAAMAVVMNREQIRAAATEMETWIANTTAAALGWGNVATQIANARREAQAMAEQAALNQAVAEGNAKFDAAQAEEAKRREDEFTTRFRRRAEEEGTKRKQQAKETADALAKIEKEWRDYQNWLGLRYMEDEKARIDATVAEAKKAAQDKLAADQAWMESVHGGMLVVGGGPQSLERPQSLSGRGNVIFDEQGNLVEFDAQGNLARPGAMPSYTPALPMSGTTNYNTFQVNGDTTSVARQISKTLDDLARTSKRPTG